MRNSVCLLIVGLLAAVSASAQLGGQRPPVPRPGAQAHEAGPKGEKKLRWICKQLHLDDKQKQQAEALLATYNAQLADAEKNREELLVRLQAKVAELQKAKEAGDKELEAKLQQELRAMAPGIKAENDFFEALSASLTEEQKAKLPEIRAKAETVGNISIRPIHVLRAARKQSLTPEQERGMEKLLDNFRASLQTDRDQTPDAATRKTEQLIQDVRALLTPEQAAKYDKDIDDMRDGAAPPERVSLPGGKAAAPPGMATPSSGPATKPAAAPRPAAPPVAKPAPPGEKK